MIREATPVPPRPVVLIVDDDPVTRALCQAVFEQKGYDVLVARDGADALAQSRQVRPAVIVLDLVMPGLDGLATATRLQADPATRDIPVVLVSAAENLTARAAEIAAVGAAVVPKQYDLTPLLQVVRQLTR